MRRCITLLLVLGLVAGALSAPAVAGKKKKKKKPVRVERVVESRYEAPALGTNGSGACLVATNSCGDIALGAGEVFAMVEITDASGLPVFASVGQDLDGDSLTDTSTDICGASEEPIALEPGYPVTIFPWAVGSADCPGVATQGVVKVTLSNLP